MDKDVFVSELKSLAPSKEDFRNYNVSDSYIKEHVSRYQCEPKANGRVKIITNDELLSLLQEYDCSALGIGNLSFVKEIVERVGYYEIGRVEMDVLVLNKVTLEIEVRDHDSLEHVIWPCASKSSYFLDSLLICARFLRSLLNDLSSEPEDAYLLGIVNQCAEKAGGEKYIDFYKMLLGYFG